MNLEHAVMIVTSSCPYRKKSRTETLIKFVCHRQILTKMYIGLYKWKVIVYKPEKKTTAIYTLALVS